MFEIQSRRASTESLRILQDVKSAWGVWAKADPGTRISAIKQRHTVNCAAIRDLEMWKQTYQPEAGKKALTEEREAQSEGSPVASDLKLTCP